MNYKEEINYKPLVLSSGLGSVLGSGLIVGIASTITIWQNVLNLTTSQVGIVSSLLTFSIAIGSFLAGKISKKMGLVNAFNKINILFIIGSILIILAKNFPMLSIGTVLAGFATGVDLPVSLTVISHDAPDEKKSAEMISETQVYWTIGILVSVIVAFITSKMNGALSAQIVMGTMLLVSILTIIFRNTNANIKKIHDLAPKEVKDDKKVSLIDLLFKGDKKYLQFFVCIIVFYCGWNLLANTFGQFQTFMLVKANASQTFATGAGLVLTVVILIVAMLFSKIAGGKNRNVAFAVGIITIITALIGLAMTASNIVLIVVWLALQNIGSTLAGEAMYKVWTQESFPSEYRSSVQGFINGFSRLLCAGFAIITPVLVMPENIRRTMIAFAGLIAIAGIFGFLQIRLQKKYNIDQLSNVKRKEKINNLEI